MAEIRAEAKQLQDEEEVEDVDEDELAKLEEWAKEKLTPPPIK